MKIFDLYGNKTRIKLLGVQHMKVVIAVHSLI